MGRDKSRMSGMKWSGMKCMERIASTIRSITRTLIAYAAAICLGAMIGLGALAGCAGDQAEDQNVTGESQSELAGAENPESDDGEESGASLGLDETYDFVRKGTRLILRYDAESNSFAGTVQNTTGEVLDNVRVEVHLSNGTELGPTTPVDLAPGETTDVSLAATGEPFTGWTPHAEVGEGEHGGGGDGEHGEGGEHGGSEGEHGEGSDGDHGGGE